MSAYIGVRELKARLSAHLSRVKAGHTVVVTEHGRPVAKLVPLAANDLPSGMARLLATGEATWSGEPLPPFDPLPIQTGAKAISEMVAEDRR